MTTHYRHGETAACTARIPRSLAQETADVDCGNCVRTSSYQNAWENAAVLPPPRDDAVADPADRAVIAEWLGRAG
jgi:hypothetical protein